MRTTSTPGLWLFFAIPYVLNIGCASRVQQGANSPHAEGSVCRVTIETRKGVMGAEVRGNQSDVGGPFASSTAVLADGVNVAIKGWLGDVGVGYLERNRFIIRAWGEEFPSKSYSEGQTSFTLRSIIGPDTRSIHSENCTDEQLGIGGVHLVAPALLLKNSSHQDDINDGGPVRGCPGHQSRDAWSTTKSERRAIGGCQR